MVRQPFQFAKQPAHTIYELANPTGSRVSEWCVDSLIAYYIHLTHTGTRHFA